MPFDDDERITYAVHRLMRLLVAKEVSQWLPETLLPEVLLTAANMVALTIKIPMNQWATDQMMARLVAARELGVSSGIETETPITANIKRRADDKRLGDESAAMVQHERICPDCAMPLKEGASSAFGIAWDCQRPECGARFRIMGPLGVERL